MDPRLEMIMRLAGMRANGSGTFPGPRGQVFEEYAGSSDEDNEDDDEDEDIDLSDYLPKPLEEMDMNELKAECKRRDLPVTGSRKTLESRIMDDIEQEHMRKGFASMGLNFGPGGDDDDEDDGEEYDGEGGDEFPGGFSLEELFGMPRAEEMEKEEWLKLWMEVDTNLREDSFMFTTFQRALNPRLMEVSMPHADFASHIAAAFASMQPEIDKIIGQVKRPYALPASKLAAVAEKIEALKQIAKDSQPKLLTEQYFSNEFDDKFPNEKALEDWSIDRVETFGTTVLAARCGTWQPTASWRGQFLLRANPITQALEFDMFRYAPTRIPGDVKLAALRLGTEANTACGRYIFEEMERFEVSRVIQLRFPFASITRVGLLEDAKPTKEGDAAAEDEEQRQEGVLVVEVSETPQFMTKRMNCQASMMNEWRPRADFTADSQATKVGRYFFLGQAVTLRDFMAFLLAQCPEAVVGTHASELVGLTEELALSQEAQQKAAAKSAAAVTTRQVAKETLNAQVEKENQQKPSDDLVDFLIASELVDAAHKSELQSTLGSMYGPCFYDFITFQAGTVDAVKELFSSELTSGASGILDVDEFGGETVLHFLKHQKKNQSGSAKSSLNASSNQFYSFCQKQLLDKDEHSHCDSCRNCRGNVFWHCHSCNKCTNGDESQKFCEHCGVKVGATDSHFATLNKQLKPKPLPLSRRLDKSGPQFVQDEDDEEAEDDDLLVYSDSDDDQPTFAPAIPEQGDDEEGMYFGEEEEDEEDDDDDDTEGMPKMFFGGARKTSGKKVRFFEDVEDIEFDGEEEDDDEEDEDEEEDDGPFASRRGGKSSKKPAKKAASQKSKSEKPTGFQFGQPPAPAGTAGGAGFAKSAFGFDVPPVGFTFEPQSGQMPSFNMGQSSSAQRGRGKGSRGPRGRL